MTPDQATVRRPAGAQLGLDPQPLFDLGLRQVRAYARESWTDHNVHDPGITMLELLCYAITDLCYRACYPVEDLLATREGNAKNMAEQFFTARQSLPVRPLTALDYRKLLIDVDGVRNAWIVPVEQVCYADAVKGELLADDPGLPGTHPVRLRGLYAALIEYADESASAEAKSGVLDAARAALQSNRNLCEDFVDVRAIEPQAFVLCGEIAVQPQADPAEVEASVLLAVARHLAPGVPRHTRAEMLQRPKPDGGERADPDLYDGPSLAHGFIDDDELAGADLKTAIRLSDVIGLVMDVEGVVAVRDLVIRPAEVTPETQAESKWVVSVAAGMRSVLDPAASRLILYKGSMPLPRGPAALERYATLKAEDEQRYAPRPRDDAPLPLGRFRSAAACEPLQKHFPAAYGIGDSGLPGGTGPERQAQAKQLQGYLHFFDQLLADAFAQLGEVRQLFSRDPGVERTYFSQPVAGSDALLVPGSGEHVLEAHADRLERRNRFLDHLLARFAERLQDNLAIQAALFGADDASAARAKCAFLGDYPGLGAGRALAFDYSIADPAGAAPTNVSGLEKRLAHLLGLGAIAYEIYQEHDSDTIDEYRFRVRRRSADGVLLSSSTKYASPDAALAELGRALELAQAPSGYQRRQTAKGDEFYFNIVDGSGEVVARRIGYFTPAAARDAAIDELIAVLAEHRSERLVVIENILLRPRHGAEESFLPICADPGCGEGCAGDDPYSCRLHIVLPALAARFRNMDFRRYAEEVIRQETPAHLLPKICWVDDEHLAKIEAAWSAWRALLAGSSASDPAGKLAILATALYEAKNVYPAPTLAGCAAPDKFILGRSALGSEPPAPA